MYLNATRLALKFGEHTWGIDVKSYLFDNSNYSNSYFNTARVSGPFASQYSTLEQSWFASLAVVPFLSNLNALYHGCRWEQRNWGIYYPLQALQAAQHPLYDVCCFVQLMSLF